MKTVGLIISKIVDDTLRKEVEGKRRFCRMKLTMLVCFITAMSFAIIDFCLHGLKLEVWYALLGSALGAKVIDGFSKRLEK